MANADMNRLMDMTRLRVPGVLDTMVRMEMFDVLGEFFRDSGVWKEDVEFTATPSEDSYAANPDAYAFDVVPYSGHPVYLIHVVNSAGVPQNATMETPGVVILGNLPSVADTYKARVSLTVVDPETSEGYPVFPAWVLKRYGHVVLDGILSRLMGQIAKPYTNTTLAAYHARRFRNGVVKARSEATRGNAIGGQTWTYPQTFNRLVR